MRRGSKLLAGFPTCYFDVWSFDISLLKMEMLQSIYTSNYLIRSDLVAVTGVLS